jgi:hypothetical protein
MNLSQPFCCIRSENNELLRKYLDLRGLKYGGSVGHYFIILFDWGSELTRYYGWAVCFRYVTKCSSAFW